jgi:hypothetical protein
MKKIYEKPAICVVKIRYQNHLLVNSQQQIHSEIVNNELIGFPGQIESIFPELAESEDERIRREMIGHFKSKTKETWCNMPVKDIIAYLEKQKEQKHPNGCFTCDEYKKGYEAGRFHGFTAGYNKAMKKQNPAEWSEEDEKKEKMLYDLIHFGKSVDFLSELYATELKDWLKSLRPQPHWKPSEEQMEYLAKAIKTLGEEVDCKTSGSLNELRNELKSNFPNWKESSTYSEGDKVSFKGEIKELHEWKPSEEQMSMLLAVIRDPNNAGSESCSLAFKSLYEDLKKL